MDILNWLYLRKEQLIKKTISNPTTDLVVLGADATFAKRGDQYQTYGMTVEDFANNLKPYKVYTALLTQTGTDAPVATVLENTLGGTPIWDYAGTGQYYATLTGAFTVDKTTVSITMSGTATIAQSNTNAIRLTNSLAGTEPDVIVISCSKADTGVGADNLFTKAFIEIRVYN